MDKSVSVEWQSYKLGWLLLQDRRLSSSFEQNVALNGQLIETLASLFCVPKLRYIPGCCGRTNSRWLCGLSETRSLATEVLRCKLAMLDVWTWKLSPSMSCSIVDFFIPFDHKRLSWRPGLQGVWIESTDLLGLWHLKSNTGMRILVKCKNQEEAE